MRQQQKNSFSSCPRSVGRAESDNRGSLIYVSLQTTRSSESNFLLYLSVYMVLAVDLIQFRISICHFCKHYHQQSLKFMSSDHVCSFHYRFTLLVPTAAPRIAIDYRYFLLSLSSLCLLWNLLKTERVETIILSLEKLNSYLWTTHNWTWNSVRAAKLIISGIAQKNIVRSCWCSGTSFHIWMDKRLSLELMIMKVTLMDRETCGEIADDFDYVL